MDVLIVGAGPSGVTLACALARHFIQAFIDRGGFMVCAPMREKTRLIRPRALFA